MKLRQYWFNVSIPTLEAYLKCSFEIADKAGLLDKTLNTSLMAVLIHKRLWNLTYVRHNRLTVNALRRAISNFSASKCNFHNCVS